MLKWKFITLHDFAMHLAGNLGISFHDTRYFFPRISLYIDMEPNRRINSHYYLLARPMNNSKIKHRRRGVNPTEKAECHRHEVGQRIKIASMSTGMVLLRMLSFCRCLTQLPSIVGH